MKRAFDPFDMSCLIAVILTAGLAHWGVAPAHAEATAQLGKGAEIKEILAKVHASENAMRGADAMLPMFLTTVRGKHPDVTDAQIQELTTLIKSVVTEQSSLIEGAMAEAYDETFSASEIDALYQFYATPAGSAVASKLSVMQDKSIEKGRLWGLTILAPEILKRMKERDTLKKLTE